MRGCYALLLGASFPDSGQDNLAIREAMIALAFNLLMMIAAVISIMLTIPPRNPARDKTTA